MVDLKLILRDKSFVRKIEYIKEETKKALFSRNCKVVFKDFSMLFIREIWKDEELLKYAYYWYTVNNELVVGWDNAPHHKEIETFPHHKHSAKGVEPSTETNLPSVIEYIGKVFTGDHGEP